MEKQNCPKCGEGCYRDFVDVEVGVIHGPWGCPNCGWSEYSEYDRSEGESPAQKEHPNYYVDQYGVMTPKRSLKDAVVRFGIDPKVIDDVFGPEGESPAKEE